MALFRRDPPPTPLVAVARAPGPDTIDEVRTRGSGEGWQSEAWRVWHELGEIHYPTTQEARLVSRVDWITKPANFDLEEAFAPTGVSELGRLIALNLYVAGEGWLIQTERNAKDRPIPKRWEVLSVGGNDVTNRRLESAIVKVRFWNPDPTDVTSADSAVRAALGPASELLTLQALSRSQARSRMATAGILLRPASTRPMVDENGEPVDFNLTLSTAMSAAINDETSTASVVPIDVEVPSEEIEFWKHLIFERPFDEDLDGRMERAIRRIALALDIWPELLLGMADVNHWGSWFLAEDTWRGHVAPVADQVAATLEVALEQLQQTVTIQPDPSELLARHATVADALSAAEVGAVGLRYIRDTIGAQDEDAPTDEEIELMLLMLGRGQPEEEEEPEVEGPPEMPEGDEEAADEEPPVPIAAAAGDATGGLGVELARVDDQLRSWLEGAVEPTVALARSRVGMQVRSHLRSDPRSAQIDGVPNTEVAATLGTQVVGESIDIMTTVHSTVTPLADRWVARLVRAQSSIENLIGELVPDEQWELSRKLSGEALSEDLTIFIVGSLDRTDAEMGVFDGRRIVALAGV